MIITIQILIILALLYVIVVLLNKIADKNNEIYIAQTGYDYYKKYYEEETKNSKSFFNELTKKNILLEIEIAELKKPSKRKVAKKSK